jgi:hypothetical protein
MSVESRAALDARLDEALDESFPASDPPAVHLLDEQPELPDGDGAQPLVAASQTEPMQSGRRPRILKLFDWLRNGSSALRKVVLRFHNPDT